MAINIQGKDYSDDELAVLAKAGVLQISQKNDPASLTLTAPALHGPFQGNAAQFGIFSTPGVRPERFSALQRPYSFASILGVQRSDYTQEILEIVTGQLAGGTSNATGFCGNPPVVGGLKTCAQTYAWGSYYVKTDLNALPLVGQRRTRADVPAAILNQGPSYNPFIPDIMYRLDDTRSQLRYELFRVGVDLERTMEVVLFKGIVGQDNSRTGWFSEFEGLDRQVKTGYRDQIAAGNPLCQAADSAVVVFNADIGGSATDGSSRDFVEVLTETYRGMKKRADRVGMSGTQFAILMRSEQFSRVTDVWAPNYSTYRSDGTTAAPAPRDGFAIQQLRLEMMRGQYLLIDGEPVPVIFSEGIDINAISNNTYSSDIFILPISWNGMPLITLEYFPMDNQYIQEFAGFNGNKNISTLNNGMFMVGERDTGLCLEFLFASRFRLILQTPFLAARVDDVSYAYHEPTRTAHPGASLYVNGGVSYRS